VVLDLITSIMADRFRPLYRTPYVVQTYDESYCHGIPLDWLSDSSLPIWRSKSFCAQLNVLCCADFQIPPYIYADIGGADRWIWFVLANLLSLAAVCPFVGSLSDIFGRRYVAIVGAGLIVVGMIICSTAHSMNVFIGGMVFAGVGAGINELTALAATSELAPTAKRGKYVAILIFTILPFCPSVLWGQLIAAHSSWRWVGALCAIWAFIGRKIYSASTRTNFH
jgi:MFS family permease